MNLTGLERLSILKNLPKEVDYATLKILDNLRMSLAFSEEEMKDWKITVDGTTGIVNGELLHEVDIPIGEKAHDFIVSAYKRVNKEKKLTLADKTAYEKFIPVSEE